MGARMGGGGGARIGSHPSSRKSIKISPCWEGGGGWGFSLSEVCLPLQNFCGALACDAPFFVFNNTHLYTPYFAPLFV